jgi:hypothetical protein
MNSLRPLEQWDRGFEPHSRNGCLCCSVHSRGLATGRSRVQGVLLTVYRIKKPQSGQGPTKGYRAIERERIIHNIALWTVTMYSLSFLFLIQKVSGLNLDDCREEADFHTAFTLRLLPSHITLNTQTVTNIVQLVQMTYRH